MLIFFALVVISVSSVLPLWEYLLVVARYYWYKYRP
jgi:hypothetical protein